MNANRSVRPVPGAAPFYYAVRGYITSNTGGFIVHASGVMAGIMARIVGALAGILLFTQANAALITYASWVEQTGTIGPNDTVEVWIRLTLDAASDPLFVDHNGAAPNWGLDMSLVPSTGDTYTFDPEYTITGTDVPFYSYEYVWGGNTHAPCGESDFIAACGNGGQYSYTSVDRTLGFRWQFGSDNYGATSFQMNPGESKDFLLAKVVPQGGGAAPGTYYWRDAGFQIIWNGFDADGNTMLSRIDLATACPTRDISCSFSRTVVPVPAAVWLFGSGLGILGWIRRKQST